MKEDRLSIPEPEKIPEYGNEKFPYVFLGDAAFPQSINLMRPFPFSDPEIEKKIYNYRLLFFLDFKSITNLMNLISRHSRARRTVENLFGILTSKWRILLKKIDSGPEIVDIVIKCCLALHNYTRTNKLISEGVDLSASEPAEVSENDAPGPSTNNTCKLNTLQTTNHGRTCNKSLHYRSEMAKYFCSPLGSLPWQWDYINKSSKF